MAYTDAPYYLDAYSLAVKRGFAGSVDDWLESLKAPKLELRFVNDEFEVRYEGEDDTAWEEIASFRDFRLEVIAEVKKAEQAALDAKDAAARATEIAGGNVATLTELTAEVEARILAVIELNELIEEVQGRLQLHTQASNPHSGSASKEELTGLHDLVQLHAQASNPHSGSASKEELTKFISLFANSNYIIDPFFEYWHESINQSNPNGYGSCTMWRTHFTNGAQGSVSRQNVLIPSEYPGAEFFHRTVITTPGDVTLTQRLENVRVFKNKMTLSFYIKSDDNRSIAVELRQSFGMGGSPEVVTSRQNIEIKTNVKRYDATFDIPSIDGKTIGLNNYLEVVIIYSEQNSDYLQTGIFDIGIVKFEHGSRATPVQQNPEDPLAVERFYQERYLYIDAPTVHGQRPVVALGYVPMVRAPIATAVGLASVIASPEHTATITQFLRIDQSHGVAAVVLSELIFAQRYIGYAKFDARL